jgi:hypothetical protein
MCLIVTSNPSSSAIPLQNGIASVSCAISLKCTNWLGSQSVLFEQTHESLYYKDIRNVPSGSKERISVRSTGY